MRVAILGNAGSGKSTLAGWLAARSGAAVLDLDTVAWQPQAPAVLRAEPKARADVAAFCGRHSDWVVEGCYANLLSAALAFAPTLIFLNPGAETCSANCHDRPWEPHKYASPREQDERLEFLLSWVRAYYTRTGDLSIAGHRACFDAYAGRKIEMTTQPALDAPPPELLAILAEG